MDIIHGYNLTGEEEGICMFAFIRNLKIFRSIQKMSVYSL